MWPKKSLKSVKSVAKGIAYSVQRAGATRTQRIRESAVRRRTVIQS